MKEEWREVHLRDICEFKYGKNLPESKRVPGKYKVYGSSSVTGTHNEFLVKGPGIIIGRKGTVGKVQYSKEDFFPIDTTYFVDIDSEQVNLLFLYYRLPLCGFEGMNSDAAIPGLNRTAAINCKINLPPLPTQQKIANILSAYDDLIENNTKRIELLEEQAQLLYEEWFVRKKFPNYENTQIDAETGLPEGWEKKGLDYLCSKITDGTHDSPKQVNDGCYLVTGKHLNKGIIDFESAYQISIEDHEKIRKRSGIEKGDILFSNIGTLGNIGVVTEDFEYSCKNVVIFKKKNCFVSFLYCYLTNPINKIKLDNQSSGVAQKFYSLSFIRRFQDFFPKEPLIKKFDEIVQPIFELKYKLHQQNQILQEARDILLPRLMMGIIEVEKA